MQTLNNTKSKSYLSVFLRVVWSVNLAAGFNCASLKAIYREVLLTFKETKV